MAANIQAAARLGAKFVRVTAGQRHPGVTREQGIEWAVDGLQKAVLEADQLRVVLAYENHTKGYPWEYCDFSQPSDVFLEIVRRMAGTSLGVNFDTANTLASGEDPLGILEAVKEKVVSVHAADIRAPGVLDPVVVGTGVVPFHLRRASAD